ncbi:hypothetical protein AB1L07_26405 [Niallia alba]|uniref:hypothetical protein n=1 Tax=Niallia alba TaxID=2729105 RepID=UPI00399FC88A
MAIIDDLKVIDGYFEENRFIMRGIAGYSLQGTYKAEGLLSLSRLIHDDEPFKFIIDNDKFVSVPVELNKELRKELRIIADEIQKKEF